MCRPRGSGEPTVDRKPACRKRSSRTPFDHILPGDHWHWEHSTFETGSDTANLSAQSGHSIKSFTTQGRMPMKPGPRSPMPESRRFALAVVGLVIGGARSRRRTLRDALYSFTRGGEALFRAPTALFIALVNSRLRGPRSDWTPCRRQISRTKCFLAHDCFGRSLMTWMTIAFNCW